MNEETSQVCECGHTVDHHVEGGAGLCMGTIGMNIFCTCKHFTPAVQRETVASYRPKIICICGSSRFVGESAVQAWEFNKQGIATFFMPLLPQWYAGVKEHHQAEAEGVAENLDNLWLKLIDMADEIFVINCGGYIGERTSIEINYARSKQKPVSYLEPSEMIPNVSQETVHRNKDGGLTEETVRTLAMSFDLMSEFRNNHGKYLLEAFARWHLTKTQPLQSQLDIWDKRKPEIEAHRDTYRAIIAWECDNGHGKEVKPTGDLSEHIRHEVERLRHQVDAIAKERNDLRAEVGRLKLFIPTIDKETTATELQKWQHDAQISDAHRREQELGIQKLQQQNAELVKALERIHANAYIANESNPLNIKWVREESAKALQSLTS